MRSYLYVPGASFAATAADAVIAQPDGSAAPGSEEAHAGPDIWVMIDAGEQSHRELRSVVRSGLTGVCVAGARSASELAALGAALAGAEEGVGLPVGRIAVMPVLETAAAVLGAAEIARAPRVARLHLGERALCDALRIRASPDERELLWLRSMVVAASAAAGIGAPIGDVCADQDMFGPSADWLRRLGFAGRACAGEGQVLMANEIFANG